METNEKKQFLLELGKRVKARREALELSQDELAKRLNYKSRSSINKIELGVNDIPQSKIKLLAAALMTTPAYLMGWRDEDGKETPDFDPATLPSHSQKSMTITSEKEKSLVRDFRSLNDEGRDEVRNHLDYVKSQPRFTRQDTPYEKMA